MFERQVKKVLNKWIYTNYVYNILYWYWLMDINDYDVKAKLIIIRIA